MSQGGGDPKWVAVRMGPMATRAPARGTENRLGDHHKHLGYVAVLGIAAGMLALFCFYLCVWLVRQSRQRTLRSSHGVGSVAGESSVGGRDEQLGKVSGSGEGEPGENPTWNVGHVELVLMAGENVPTFLAHPLVHCTSADKSDA
jgi:hypothetical protein